MIDENYILIDSGSNPPELYAIEDRKQQRNLADHPDTAVAPGTHAMHLGNSPTRTRFCEPIDLAPRRADGSKAKIAGRAGLLEGS